MYTFLSFHALLPEDDGILWPACRVSGSCFFYDSPRRLQYSCKGKAQGLGWPEQGEEPIFTTRI